MSPDDQQAFAAAKPAPHLAPLPRRPVVAVVGATGAVGTEMLRVLEARGFPLAELRLLASRRSAGTAMPFRGEALVVAELGEDCSRAWTLPCSRPGASGRGGSRRWRWRRAQW